MNKLAVPIAPALVPPILLIEPTYLHSFKLDDQDIVQSLYLLKKETDHLFQSFQDN